MVDTEAIVRNDTQADIDQDEAGTGYMMVKFTTGAGARQSYFQFDLTGQNADLSQTATFSMFLQSNGRSQTLQVWALDQAYVGGFTDGITWNNAQANDTTNNDLLTTGALTATTIGSTIVVPGSVSTGDEVNVSSSSLSPFVFDNKITFVVTGVNAGSSAANSANAAGFRAQRNNSELEFAVVPEPSSAALLGLAGFGFILRRRR